MSGEQLELVAVSVLRQQQTLLDKVSLSVAQGDIVTVIGPNGAGKSTLVKVLLGLVAVDSGQVRRPLGWRIGYMPQQLTLNPYLPLRVIDFLQLAGRVSVAMCQEALARVNASALAHKPMTGLSGGECQRVLLARAILRQPQLLVLDEPVQGVDVTGQAELYQLIGQLRDELACGVLMVSHDLHLVMSATDRVICLNQHICCSGHPDVVSQDPAYHALFGREAVTSMALYTHHHDHAHAMSGAVEETSEC